MKTNRLCYICAGGALILAFGAYAAPEAQQPATASPAQAASPPATAPAVAGTTAPAPAKRKNCEITTGSRVAKCVDDGTGPSTVRSGTPPPEGFLPSAAPGIKGG